MTWKEIIYNLVDKKLTEEEHDKVMDELFDRLELFYIIKPDDRPKKKTKTINKWKWEGTD